MENATKALLIAGSVLIAILLIAVGLKIFNSTTGTTEATKTTMDATAVAVFNNKFVPYLGKAKSKGEVISLLNAVIANNSTNSTHEIQILYKADPSQTVTGASNWLQRAKSVLSTIANETDNKTYKVKIGNSSYDDNNTSDYYPDGAIKVIFIIKNN